MCSWQRVHYITEQKLIVCRAFWGLVETSLGDLACHGTI